MTTLSALGNEFRLNTLTSPLVDVTQNPVVVAELAGGGFVAIWQVADTLNFPQDGSGASIFGQVFDNNGNPVGSMFQVDGATPTAGSTGTLNNQLLPSVTGLADGGFVVVWESNHVAARGFDIYGQRYDSTGTRVGTTQFQVNDQATDPIDVQNASVTSVPGGGYLATWTQTSAVGNYEVFGRYFNAAGTATTGNFQINTTTALNQIQASAAVLSDGTAIVVWQSDQDAGGGFGIYGQHIAADGSKLGGELHISTTTANAQYAPSVVALDTDNDGQLDDGFVVVWTSDGQDGSGSGIFGQKYDAAFNKVGGEFLVNQTTAGDQASASIVHLSSGQIVVTWQGVGANGTNEVFARRFDASSNSAAPTPVTNEVLVNQTTQGEQTTGTNVIGTTTPRAFDHNVVQLSNGDLAIVWSDAGSADVFGRLFSVNVPTTDAPVVTALAKNPVFGTEFGVNRAPVDLFHTVNVTTEGGDNIDVLTLTVSNVVNGAAEKLRIDGTLIDLIAGAFGPTAGGFSGTVAVSGTTATVTINAGAGGATAAQMTTLIDGLAYDNESLTPGPTRRVVTLTSISDTNDNGTPGADTRTLVATSSTVSPPRINEIVSVSTDSLQVVQPPNNAGALVNITSDLLTPQGVQVNEGSRYISADGRFVAFASSGTNLVAGDTNGGFNGAGQDVFVRDMLNGTTERVSINDDESQMTGLSSGMVSISADGNRVLFDRDGELWVRDRAAQTTTKVSISDGGTPVFVGFVPSEISGDGTKVVFAAGPTINGLVSGDTNNASDVFVRDLTTNTTVRVSTATGGTQTNTGGHSSSPAISNTGQFVAFVSTATNLVTAGSEGGADTNGFFDVFRKDLATGTTIRVSLTENDLQSTANPGGGGNSFQPAISADGNLIVFNSLAQLTAGDTDNLQDIYLRNVSAGTTTLISNSPLLLASTSNVSPAISPDGRYVSYGSTDNNAIFIFDTQTGLTSRAEVFTNGFQGEASPGVPAALANGYIAFSSGFNHLVTWDTNAASIQDIFTSSIDSLVLGGTIWNDSAGGITGDGIKQAGEAGIAGVRLSLLADLNNDNVPDTPDTPIRSTITSATGDYQFNGLAPGNYIVRVDQDNFDAGGLSVALVATPISPGGPPDNPADPDNNVDNDDNGSRALGEAGFSKAITLDYGTEPINDGDTNASTNLTLDFGFMANPPPVIANLDGDTVAFTEDGTAVLLDTGSNATVTDVNNTNFNGGNVIATVSGGNAQDQLSILSDNTIQVVGTTVSFDPTGTGTGFVTIGTVANLNTSSLTVTFTTTDATPAAASALLQHLTYVNTNHTEPPSSRTVAVTVSDGLGGTSTTSNVTVNITQVNDEPTLSATGQNPTFTEDQAAVVLYSGAAASTVESGQTFQSLKLTVTNVTDGTSEILKINNVDVPLVNGNTALGGSAGSAGVSLSGNTATVTVTGATLDATQLQNLINAITYRNTSQDPTDANRVVTITQVVDSGPGVPPPVGNDNTADLSIVSTVNVNPVNDPPTLTATGNNPTFTEDGAPADVYSAVTASTIEAGQTFTSLTLTVTNVTDGASEILFFDGSDVTLTAGTNVLTATNSLNVSVGVTGTTATVTFAGAGLNATQLQTLVDAITYRNTSQNPTDANRVVTITQLVDSDTGPGNNTTTLAVASIVNVDPVNDPPTLDLDANNSSGATGADYQALYKPLAPPVSIADGDVSIIDVDDTNMESATITISNVQAGDLLTFNGSAPPGIVVNGAGTTSITLTGSASKAAYQAALVQVQFSNSNASPSTTVRDILVVLNDGTAASNLAHAFITLNEPPVIAGLSGDTATFLEDSVNPVFLDDAASPASVTDADDPNFNGGSLTVSITNDVAGEDVLGIKESGTVVLSAGTTVGSTVTVGGSTIGTITSNGSNGNDLVVAFNTNATPANVGLLIQALTYFNTNTLNPSTAQRTIDVTVNDGHSGTTENVFVNVNAVNDAPVNVVQSPQSTNEDTNLVLTGPTAISVTDDALGDITMTLSVGHGTLTFGGSGAGLSSSTNNAASIQLTGSPAAINTALSSLTYAPTPDYNGPDQLLVLTNDNGNTGSGGTMIDSDTINITVNAVADIANDTATTNEDTPVTVSVLANDTFEGTPTVTGKTDGAHGTVSINVNNTVVYTPIADFNGTDSFTYTVTSGGVTETATVNVTVNAIADIVNDNVSVAEDSGANSLNLLGNDTFENSNRAITAVGAAAHGTTSINNNGTPGNTADDFVVYTPAADYNGPDAFTYTVTSGGVTETANVNVTVTAVADIVNDTAVLSEDTPGSIFVLANDTFEGTPAITGTTNGAHGTVSVNNNGTPGNTADDFIVYTQSVPDFNGTDSFTYTVTSGGLTETATVNVTISPVADIVNDAATTRRDTAVDVLVLANDTFENIPAITGTTNGAHGTVAVNTHGTASTADDSIIYTPNLNFFGPDAFTYTVTSGGVTETATVNVNVGSPPAFDFNADGRGDILWQNVNGTPAVWLLNGTAVSAFGPALVNPGASWHEIDSADFNADGKSDILWQNADGTPAVWLMDGVNLLSPGPALPNPGPTWHADEAADFNGDGKADILWQNNDGTPAVWLMDGVNVLSFGPALANPGPTWQVKDAADFNGDGKADILWQNANGTPAVWLMNGTDTLQFGPALPNPGPTWHEIAAGDFNGDGKADILWQNSDGTPAVWLMDGVNVLSFGPALPNPGASWHAVEAEDANGDGKADILWQNTDGTPAVWLMNGTAVSAFGPALINPGSDWHVI